MALKPGTFDHTYMGFYADTGASSTRSAWLGFGGAGTSTMSVANEMTNGALQLTTTGASGDIALLPGGKVGVGTAAPAAKLDVAGGINFSLATSTDSNGIGYLSSSQNFDHTNASGTFKVNHYGMTVTNFPSSAATYVSGYGELGLFSGGANRLNISSSGNVGIGTTSASSLLHLKSTGGSIVTLENGGTSNAVVNSAGGDGSLIFQSNSTNVMRLMASGNVGIGTTNPGAKLEVNGALKVGGSETGTAADDIKAYIQKMMCENRRGVWVDGTGCTEFAYYTAQCVYGSCSCAANYHMCSLVDMFSGGFQSLRRPGYDISTVSGVAYAWVAGAYTSEKDKFFYPWERRIS